MPIVLRENGYRFGFYASDQSEPAHVHVEKGKAVAKYWLETVELSQNHGFRPHDLNEIRKIIVVHQEQLLEAWNEFFKH
jgi:hypothetical protein